MSARRTAAPDRPGRANDRPGGGAWRDAALVAAAALVVRLASFFVNSRGNPAFDYLIMDSVHIDRWARALAEGEQGPAVYFRGPLYPYLLSLIYRLSGGSVAAAVLVNHTAGAATCGLLVLLGRCWFPRSVALVAGLVAAFYWPFIFFEGEILVEPSYILILVLFLLLLSGALASPTLLRLVAVGACLGLAALARPTALALLAVVPFAFHFARRGPETARWTRAWLRPTALVAVASALVLAPATIHNYHGSGALVPVAWSGGLNFYLGNNAAADGGSAWIPGARSPWMGGEDEALAIASEQAGRSLTPSEASSFFTARGLDFFASEPLAAAKLNLRKLGLFWEGPERSNEKYIYFFWKRYGLGRVPMPGFWLVAPLAIVGLARLWPRRRELALLYGFVLVYALAVAAFFVVARFRLPAAPVLILFASWAVVDIVRAARSRERARVIGSAALLVAGFLAVNASYPRFLRQRPTHDIISHYTLAAALTERKDPDGALVELARARAAFERAPSRQYAATAQDVYFKLGTLLFERGRCRESADALGQILPGDPRATAARYMFAECCEKTGRFAEAGRAYRIILKSVPDDERALAGLVRCLEGVGEYDEAARVRARLPTR